MSKRSKSFRALVPVLLIAGIALPSCGGDDAPPGGANPVGGGGGFQGGTGGMGGDPDSATAGSNSGGTVDQGGSNSGGTPDQGGSSSGGTPDQGGSGGGGEAGGSGSEVSGVVTPEEGGTLTLGTTTVAVPPGAVAEPTTITIAAINPSSASALPEGFTGVGPMVALLPHGLTFDQPVTVTLEHTSTEPSTTLVVLSLDDEQDTTWENVAGPSFTATTVTFETTTFSIKMPAWTGAERLYTDGIAWVGHIALGGGKLFYSRAHPSSESTIGIRSINIDGSGAAPVSAFALTDSVTNAMVTTSTTLFFAAGQNLYSVPIVGGSLATYENVPCGAGTLDSPINPGVPRLVTDTTQLFCTTIGSDAFGELKSISFAGAPLVTVPDLMAPSTIAVDGLDLLYSAFGGIFRIPKTLDAPSTATEIDSDEFAAFPGSSVHGIVHDETFIYVLTISAGHKAVVWRKPRGGEALQQVTVPLDATPGGARGLLLVGSNLYFALQLPAVPALNQDSGSYLQRVAKTANSATPDTMGGANQSNLVTDGTYVYYGNGADLHRLPN